MAEKQFTVCWTRLNTERTLVYSIYKQCNSVCCEDITEIAILQLPLTSNGLSQYLFLGFPDVCPQICVHQHCTGGRK